VFPIGKERVTGGRGVRSCPASAGEHPAVSNPREVR